MNNFLPTKFYIPPIPAGFIERPQLLARLDEALNCRLALISAPAGAGKTILVSAWVQSIRKKGIAVVWLSLEDADDEPGRFLKCLMGALEEGGMLVDPASRQSEGQGPLHDEPLLQELARCLQSHSQELILILDDYHIIRSQAIHTALGYLIEHAHPKLHLILVTRSDPPLQLARLRAAGQLVEIRMEQLRFSTQETGDLLEKSTGIQLPEEAVGTLNDRTEGWIAGLQMAAISLRSRDEKRATAFIAAFAGSHRYVFDYLLEQVLSQQPPAVRDFLLKTSILDRLTAPLCDQVAETAGNARGMLDLLERENLFLVPLDDERGWYRYHHLFSELLQVMLEQAYPGLAVELHHRACHWYEQQGMPQEALNHGLTAGDMELVAKVISANALVLIENNEAASILKKIDAIPTDQLSAIPWLGIARGWLQPAGQVRDYLRTLEAAEKTILAMPEDNERQRLQAHLAAVRAQLFGQEGDVENALRHAKLADALLPREEIAARAMNLTFWGDVLSAPGHDPAALPILEQALELAMQAEKPHAAMCAATALASAHLGAGNMHAMYRICTEALAYAEAYQERTQNPIYVTSGVYSMLSRVLAEWGECQQAVAQARKALLLVQGYDYRDTDDFGFAYLARALVFADEWEQARSVFDRAYTAAQKISPWHWRIVATFELDSLLDCEKQDEHEIARSIRRLEESGAEFPPLLKARLLLRDGHPDQVFPLLDRAHAELKGSLDKARIHALRALAYQALGKEKQALQSLRKALELTEPENRVMTLVREGPAMEQLLRRPGAKAIAPAFVTKLLAFFEARHKRRPTHTSASEWLIEPLSERELEILQHLNSYLSTPEIAGLLMVSTNTIRTHIKNIYGKLGVHGRSGAVRRAGELGLLATS